MKHVLAKDEDFEISTSGSGKVKLSALAGESMPGTPTQNETAEAVKKIFVALGGTVTNGTQNVEAGRGLE